MKLLTVQPKEIIETLKKGNTVYPNDKKIENYHLDRYDDGLIKAYKWLTQKMEEKGKNKTRNSKYPFWAWFKYDGEINFDNVVKDDYINDELSEGLIIIDIPEDDLILSDFDSWHSVINDDYFNFSLNEEEWNKSDSWYESLSDSEKEVAKELSWNEIFNIEDEICTEWLIKNRYVQASFWYIKPENVVAYL